MSVTRLRVDSFDADIIVDDDDEVEGLGNANSLGIEPYRFEPFLEGAEHEDSDSELNAAKRHFYHAALLALRKTWLYHALLPGDWLREDSLMTSRGSCIQLRPARHG